MRRHEIAVARGGNAREPKPQLGQKLRQGPGPGRNRIAVDPDLKGELRLGRQWHLLTGHLSLPPQQFNPIRCETSRRDETKGLGGAYSLPHAITSSSDTAPVCK